MHRVSKMFHATGYAFALNQQNESSTIKTLFLKVIAARKSCRELFHILNFSARSFLYVVKHAHITYLTSNVYCFSEIHKSRYIFSTVMSPFEKMIF